MARSRQRNNEDLPENLRVETKADGRTYYSYVMPDGRKKAVGNNRDAAVISATKLNSHFAPIREQLAKDKLIQKLTNPLAVGNPPLNAVIEEFKKTELSHLAELSRERAISHLTEISNALGRKRIQSITTYHVAQFLKPHSEHAKKQRRNTLMQLWKYAKEEGHTNDNAVSDTRAVKQPPRVRKRHTMQGFQQMRGSMAPWLEQASLLALYSIQRRSDLVNIQWSQVDMQKRTFQVLQKKTKVWLDITMGEDLYNVFKWFHNQRDPKYPDKKMDTSFVVHRRPQTRNKVLMTAVREGRQELFQVTPDTLTKQFSKARDKSGAYDHLEAKERPALHDMRALGIFALSKAGYPDEYIQLLAGHADVEMTRYYMQGHEQVRPIAVEAGLSIEAVNWDTIDWSDSLSPALERLIKEVEAESE